MSKLGFKFSAVPRDRHPEWFNCTMLTRGLGLELYIASCAEDGKSRPIPASTNWRTSLCRTLCIEPEERPGISQCFSAMERRGLIKVEDGAVHIVWQATDKLFRVAQAQPEQPPPCDPAEPPLKDPCSPPVGGLRRGTNGNDSTHVLQREEIEERERTRARPELKSVEPDTAWIRLGKHYQALFDAEQEGTRAPRLYDEQRIVSVDAPRFRKLLELTNAEAARSGSAAKQIFEAATLAFLRDAKQREKGFVLEFFARDFARYVDMSLEAAS